MRHSRRILLTAVLLTTCSAFAQQPPTEERVKLAQVLGKVEIRTPQAPAWRAARVGQPVKVGWDVRTYVESDAQLAFGSGTQLRVGENSVVTVSKAMVSQSGAASNTAIKVATGQIWANVKKLANQKSTFEFETPTATASIRGTRLGINVGKAGTSIDVYEGLVMVRPNGSNRETPVPKFTRAVIAAGGREVQLQKFDDKAHADSGGMVDPFAGAPALDSSGAPPAQIAGTDSTPAAPATAAVSDSAPAAPTRTPLVLSITSPLSHTFVNTPSTSVKGRVTPGAALLVSGKESPVGADGSFNANVDLEVGANRLPVSATLGDQSTVSEVVVEYRPPLFLNVTNVIDNMEVASPDFTLELEVSEGARYSVNGKEGVARVQLKPGNNVIAVRAWDAWNNRTDRSFSIKYRTNGKLLLTMTQPPDGSKITETMIQVSGNTTPGALVTVNGGAVPVSSAGSFSTRVPIPDEPQDYTVTVVATLGDEEMTSERTVTYEPIKEPLSLSITSPLSGLVVKQRTLRIAGKTTAGAKVTINGRSSTVSPSGLISAELQFAEADLGDYTIDVSADDGDQEVTASVRVTVDITSPQLNTSVPSLVVQGAGQPATKVGDFGMQVLDRTPEDQVTVSVENNSSRDEYQLASGGRETFRLEEGANKYTIVARDVAGNASNTVVGETYFLPGPLSIDIVEPMDNPYVIDDLPPLPRNTSKPTLKIKVEVDDGIGTVPRTIKYCKVIGSRGEMLLRNNNDYTFSGTLDVGRGSNAFTITTEDLAGNTATKRFEMRIAQ